MPRGVRPIAWLQPERPVLATVSPVPTEAERMKLLLWLILLVICWPLALMALLLWPLVWLISLPFRLIGISVEAVFALLRALLFLPARLLGHRDA